MSYLIRPPKIPLFSDRGLDDSEDESTSEEEEDSPNFTAESTAGFFRALAALKVAFFRIVFYGGHSCETV